MREFEINPIGQGAIQYLYTIRDEINQSPVYQRVGDVWTKSKRQLLIDSIINGLDVPKIYFHQSLTRSPEFVFSIIDGRQRIAAIFDFIENKFPLAADFEYYKEDSVDLKGLFYRDIKDRFPKIRSKFDAITLPIVIVRTDDLEIIEELFYRLNEAAPLNAAEKRNAFSGPLPSLIREIAARPFFASKLKVSATRYRHLDIATKLIYLSYRNRVVDTKKVHLDKFVKDFSGDLTELRRQVVEILSALEVSFNDNDELLSKSGLIPVFYIFSLLKGNLGSGFELNRDDIANFINSIAQTRSRLDLNQILDDENIENSSIDFDLVEFDRLTQTPNDAYSIRFKLEIMIKAIIIGDDQKEMLLRLDEFRVENHS